MNRKRRRPLHRPDHRAPETESTQSSRKISRRRVAVLLGALLMLAATFFYVGGVARLSNHFAESAIADRDHETARSWLEVSASFSPRNARHHFLAARIARREGDLPRMREQLELAQRYGFDRERIRREHVLALAQSGRLEGIEAEINQWLIQGDPESAEIIDAYANGLAASSRFPSALRVLEAWHEDLPNDPVPLYRIGRIHEHSDDLEEAEAKYREALAVAPQYYPASYSLGRLLLEEKQPKEAIKYFEHCLAAPRPAAAKVGVARCLIEMGETDRAAELLHNVASLPEEERDASYRDFGEQPERFIAAAELGKLKANAGEFAEAKRWLEKAIQYNPRDIAARYSLAVALRGLGENEEAEAEFEHVRAVQEALEKVKVFQDRIGRNPEDTDARLALGKLLLEYESERTGLFWLRSVLVYDGDNPQAHQALAEYYGARAAQSREYAELARIHRQHAAQARSQDSTSDDGAPLE